ncbi:hypothetical protein [Raoultibacter massiliensis]|uniref:Uncharacterized protein n=1 Tax=Raoultibacter massiliensis TaxID=1852371 RepID=A0ABV1JE11_9ACTN|nr:hypothetical protein [Raoultibacter massiliensis]
MDQQIITYAIGLAVVVVLGASYLRFKRHEGEGEAESSTSIKQTMAEAREYFGISPKDEDDRLARTLDLTPMKMLSGVFAPPRKKKSLQDEKKEKE